MQVQPNSHVYIKMYFKKILDVRVNTAVYW